MLKTRQIIKDRIKDLERELARQSLNDFLSIELIEADLEKLRHMRNYAESLHKKGFAIQFLTKSRSAY